MITGRFARAADLEELQRLGLDALGGVEHHHHGIDSRQHAVGVLREVAVARRVEQVHDVVAVRELHHGRTDRDAALLFELHPVAACRPTTLPGVHRAGHLHGAGVQQELLGQRRLAGVGVADDRKGAAALGLGDLVHGRSRLPATLQFRR